MKKQIRFFTSHFDSTPEFWIRNFSLDADLFAFVCDSTIAQEYNPKPFVDASHMTNSELLVTVRKIDADDELWAKIVSEPLMTPAQYEKWQSDDRAYRAFTRELFIQPVEDAKRLQQGFWPDNARRQFMLSKAKHFSKNKRILASLGRETKLGDILMSAYWKVRR